MALFSTIVILLVTNLGRTHKTTKREPSEAASAALTKRLLAACAAQDRSHMTLVGLRGGGGGSGGRGAAAEVRQRKLLDDQPARRTYSAAYPTFHCGCGCGCGYNGVGVAGEMSAAHSM